MRLLTALAFALAAATAGAQEFNGLYCGGTGFDLNFGSTSQSAVCRPGRVTRGAGTLTLTATDNTVTCVGTYSSDCFAPMNAIQAVPAVGNFFTRAGLIVRQSDGIWQWYNVTARTSSTELEVVNGATAPTVTMTSSTWAYWNTTCYRANTDPTLLFNDAGTDDQRLWDVLGTSSMSVLGTQPPLQDFVMNGKDCAAGHETGIWRPWVRPAFLKQFGQVGGALNYGTTAAGQVRSAGSWTATAFPALFSMGVEYTLAQGGNTVASYAWICTVRGE